MTASSLHTLNQAPLGSFFGCQHAVNGLGARVFIGLAFLA